MANLSNINNKFLFTDGDFLKIGNLAPINNISGNESGISITNPNVASIALDNTAASGKTFVIYSDDGGKLNFYDVDASSGRLIIDSSGNSIFTGQVSVGNYAIPSDHQFQIAHLGQAYARFALTNSQTGNGSSDGLIFQMENLNSIIKNQENGSLGFGTNGRETDILIDSSGNSTFAGNVSITKASTPELILTDTTNNHNLLIAVDDSNTFLRSSSGVPILFQTNAGTTALTLDASQNSTFAKNISVTDGTLTLNKSDGSLVKFVYNNTTRGYIGSSRQLFIGGLEADMGYLATGDSVFGAGGAERMRIDSNGSIGMGANSASYRLRVKSDATVDNGIYLSAGTGSGNHSLYVEDRDGTAEFFAVRGDGEIRLNASNQGHTYARTGIRLGANAAANNLDDYEEGTWTPTLKFNNGEVGITYAGAAGSVYRGGHYTKIGRVVTFSFRIILTSKGTSTGDATISGLPYDVGGLNGNYGSAMYSFANNFLIPLRPTITIDSSSSIIRLRFVNSPNGNYGNITNSDFNNNSDIILTGVYQTA